MTEELVAFPTAKLAREKGFQEHCRHGYEWYVYAGKEYGPAELDMPEIPSISSYPPQERYHPNNSDLMKTMAGRTMKWPFFKNSDLPPYLYARPTQDLLERWLREKHRSFIELGIDFGGWVLRSFTMLEEGTMYGYREVRTRTYQYELAREAALLHALNLLPDATGI